MRVRLPPRAQIVLAWSNGRTSEKVCRRLFPGQSFFLRCCSRWARPNIHLGRWCWLRILRRSQRGGSGFDSRLGRLVPDALTVEQQEQDRHPLFPGHDLSEPLSGGTH